MYEIFNPSKKYTLPDGTKADGAALEKDFPLCTSVPYAAVASDGVLSELSRLSVIKDAYNVDETDDEKAIAAINEEIKRRNAQRVIDDEAIETTQNAVGELGVMAATGFDSTAELGTLAATSMQSTAELGATVAALETRIAALEAAKA